MEKQTVKIITYRGRDGKDAPDIAPIVAKMEASLRDYVSSLGDDNNKQIEEALSVLKNDNIVNIEKKITELINSNRVGEEFKKLKSELTSAINNLPAPIEIVSDSDNVTIDRRDNVYGISVAIPESKVRSGGGISKASVQKMIDASISGIEISGGQVDLSGYTPLSLTASISGNLQSQIDNIVQEGTTIASSGGSILVTQNGNAFNLEVASAPIQDHNLLSGLQGIGGDGGYFHLTDIEYSELIGRTEVASISGNLQSQINFLTAATSGDIYTTDVLLPGVNVAPGYDITLDKTLSYIWSSGRVYGFDLVNNGNGTVNISGGAVMLRDSASTSPFYGNLIPCAISATLNLSLVDDETNYIYADYNSGSPILAVNQDLTTINALNQVLLYSITRVGTALYYLPLGNYQTDFMAKYAKKMAVQKGYDWGAGAVVTESDTRKLDITAGMFYYVNDLIATPAINTNTGGATFTYCYRSATPGLWTRTNSQTTIDRDYYDNGSGTLQALGPSNYGCHWLFFVLDTPTKLYVVYGVGNYSTLALATNATLPTVLPSEVHKYSTGIFIAKIITQRNDTNFINIGSPFTSTLSYSTANTHNALGGLQGGTLEEYYHHTYAQYNDFIGKTEVASISGNLNTLISNEVTNRTNADLLLTPLTTTASISGNLQTQISNEVTNRTNADLLLTPLTTTASISGNLNTRINLLEAIKDDTNEPNGFVNRTDSTLYYTPATATFAISGNYSVYLDGNKFSKTGDSVTLTPAYGPQYIYYTNGTAAFTISPTLFDIAKDSPIAYVFFNAGATDSFLAEERHGITMDGVTHEYLHRTVGAKYVSGMALGDYIPNSDTVANNKYSIAAGTFYDEDILNSVTALPDDGPYNIFYRTGASGNWTWSKTEAYPYFINANSIRYNQFTGATWQLTDITTNNRWVNYYVFATNAVTPGFGYVIIPGQAIYSSLALAQGESVSNLSFGNLPFAEIVPVARVTHQFSSAFANANGKARIVAVASLTSTSFASAIATASNHNSLSGLQGGVAGEYYHLTSAESLDFIGKTEVASISGNLQTQISNEVTNRTNADLLLTPLTTTASISGNLQTQITTNNSNAVHITGNETIAGVKTFLDTSVIHSGTGHTTSRSTYTRTDGGYTAGDFHLGLSESGRQGLTIRNGSSSTDLVTFTSISGGQVLIGTISAAATYNQGNLQVSGTTANSAGSLGNQFPQVTIYGGNTNNRLEFGVDNKYALTTSYIQCRNSNSANAGPLLLNPNGGKVIIGTDPAGAELVQIGGSFRSTGASTITNSGSLRITNDQSGVGNVLFLRNSISAAGAFTQLLIGNDNSATQNYIFATSSTNTQYAGVNSLNIGSAGNVGILAGSALQQKITSTESTFYNPVIVSNNSNPILRLASAYNVYDDLFFNTGDVDQVQLRGSSYGLNIKGAAPRLAINGEDANRAETLYVNGNSLFNGTSTFSGTSSFSGINGNVDISGAMELYTGSTAKGFKIRRFPTGQYTSEFRQSADDGVEGLDFLVGNGTLVNPVCKMANGVTYFKTGNSDSKIALQTNSPTNPNIYFYDSAYTNKSNIGCDTTTGTLYIQCTPAQFTYFRSTAGTYNLAVGNGQILTYVPFVAQQSAQFQSGLTSLGNVSINKSDPNLDMYVNTAGTQTGSPSISFRTDGRYDKIYHDANGITIQTNYSGTSSYFKFLSSTGVFESTGGISCPRGVGTGNQGFGDGALNSTTTGNYNTAVGKDSLYSNAGGLYNTAVGTNSLPHNTTGNNNSAFGLQALYANTTGGNNSAVGLNSLTNSVSGSNNVALGYQAGYNSTVALRNLDNCTFIGTNANSSANIISNSMALGYNSQVTKSNHIVIGDTNITETQIRGIYGNTTGTGANVVVGSDHILQRSTSSKKYKTAIEPIADEFADKLLEVEPVYYRSTCVTDPVGWSYYGVLAEDVAAIDPRFAIWDYEQTDFEDVEVTSEVTNISGGTIEVKNTVHRLKEGAVKVPVAVDYGRFTPHLINIAKRQQVRIKSLEERLLALEEKMEDK